MSRQIEASIDQLRESDKIRKILKERFKMNDFEIRDKVGLVSAPGQTHFTIKLRVINDHEKTEDLLRLYLSGEIEILKTKIKERYHG